ncbi:PKD domain-containing protein [Mucilaginibacter sp.]
MFKKIATLSCYLFFVFNWANGQGLLNVSPLNGSANINIPIYTVTSGQLSAPISLSYSTNGVKPLDVEGTGGMGWSLNVGGQVSRVLRGIPDDCTKDNAGNALLGWMSSSNTAASAISGFNTVTASCTDEATLATNINSTFPANEDTEPDLFYVNAPGLSCEMVFDRSRNQFHPVNYQDLIISYVNNPTTGLITSFTITNDKGIKYVFGAYESVSKTTSGNPSYFATENTQYAHGVNFCDNWGLSSITDVNGNSITFTYSANTVSRSSTDPVSLCFPNSNISTLQYNIYYTVTSQRLSSIQAVNANGVTGSPVSFSWSQLAFANMSNQDVINTISFAGTFLFANYSQVVYTSTGFIRYFLRSVSMNGCSSPVNYQFTYGGETLTSGNYTTILPDSASKQLDYWGYANYSSSSLTAKVWENPGAGSLPYAIYFPNTYGGAGLASTLGTQRIPGTTNVDAGCLKTITYPQGGTTSITYESNQYLDIPSNSVVSGGGIRVNQTTDYDGISTGNNIVTNYTYNNPSGVTSGRPVTLPQFAFAIPYSGTLAGQALYDKVTVLSDYDLSTEDHSILYSYFRVTRLNGSTQYHYLLPATNWDVSASGACSTCSGTPEWYPTVDNIARTSCPGTYGLISSATGSYPFIPNPNYDFERGILQSVIKYNSSNVPVSEDDYTYTRYQNAPLAYITAFKSENNTNGSLLIKSYGKYNIYYNTGELMATTTKTVYDSPTLSHANTVVTNYTYGSANHHLLTQLSTTNSDKSVSTANIQYVKDFPGATSSPYSDINALYLLKTENINIPVEKWEQVTRSGITYTTNASYTSFGSFQPNGTTIVMPSKQYKLNQTGGVTNFTQATIGSTGVSYNGGYFPVANYDTYDGSGFPQTIDNTYHKVNTAILDHITNNVTANFTNAAVGEVGFSDFDTDNPIQQSYNFSITPATAKLTATGSHAGNAYGLNTTQTITKTVIKNSTAQNYIFSIWINNTSTSNATLNVNLVDGSNNTPKIITATGNSTWTYYELKFPVTTMAGNITLNVTSNLAVSIDDILLYPDVAQVSTATFDPLLHIKLAATNTNGVSAYYSYDVWGRLLFSYDQDHNIVGKQTYISSNQIAQGIMTPVISYAPTTVIAGSATTFSTPTDPCLTGTSYAWTFSDGGSITSALNGATASHTYTATGPQTVTVTATNSLFPAKTTTQNITVYPPPLVVTICESGVFAWDNCHLKAVGIQACDSAPSDATHSYYTVESVTGYAGYGTTLTYQWQTSSDGVTWSNVGANSTSYSVAHAGHTVGYYIRCVVTSNAPLGQSGASSSIEFTVQSC